MNIRLVSATVIAAALVAVGGYWWLAPSDQKQASGPEFVPAVAEEKPDPVRASINTQSRNDFNAFVLLYLPASMCKADNFFRRCYLVTEDTCLETAREVIEQCLEIQAEKMGNTIKAGEDVRYWQAMTGRCAGKFYDRQLGQYRKEEEGCLSVSPPAPEPTATEPTGLEPDSSESAPADSPE